MQAFCLVLFRKNVPTKSYAMRKLDENNTDPLLSDSVKERLSYNSAKCSAGAWFRGNYLSFVRGLMEFFLIFFSLSHLRLL